MINQNDVEKVVQMLPKKMPLDVRIVKWFLFVVSFISFCIGLLLLSGLSHISSTDHRVILFGILSLTSGLSFGIYYSCMGFMAFFCGYWLSKRAKLGWWCLFIESMYNSSDALLIFSHHKLSVLIGISINLGLIIWLFYRRRLYGIGIN